MHNPTDAIFCSLFFHSGIVGVFGPPMSKFIFIRLARMVCSRTQEFILVRAERPYVQFAAARVTGTWFAVVTPSVLHRKSFTKICN